MSTPTASAQPGQYLTFRVAGDEYALPILKVREIIQYQPITHVPSAPACIRGVLNLRGSVVPVIDLARKFGLADSTVSPHTCVVVIEVKLEDEATVMGVQVDSVSQVLDLIAAQIQPPPAFGTRVRLDYLNGMGEAGKHFVLMLDVDRILSLEELLSAELVSDGIVAEPGVVPEVVAVPAP